MTQKATEAKLSSLHGALARVMTEQVLTREAVTEFDVDGIEQPTGETFFSASPALLATAAKFLKDNSITADIQADTNLGELEEALAKKQKRSRMTPEQAAGRMQ